MGMNHSIKLTWFLITSPNSWQNFCEHIVDDATLDKNGFVQEYVNDKLAPYNAKYDSSSVPPRIVFETESDKVMWVLKWS